MTCELCRWHLHSTADDRKVICVCRESPHRDTLVKREATCEKWEKE